MHEDHSINHDTILETIVNKLRRMILKGHFKQGERLPQRILADMFGVSRTPIREALQQLEKEGLVVNSPYKGASVVPLDADDVSGIYHIRIALESYAAELAMQKISDEETEALQKLVTEMRQAYKDNNLDELLSINRTFYLTFYACADEPQVYNLAANYIDLAQMYRQWYTYRLERAEHIIEDHEMYIQAIIQRDTEKVVHLTRIGLREVAADLIKNIQASPDHVEANPKKPEAKE